ncbi:MAG: hypothetical protein KF855_11805 [Acidobacteria bacterium]|nr:hypothetical protein [Acidobacteriota bacterium]
MLKTLKISFVLVPMSVLLVVGVYIYSLWASDRQMKADLPVEAADVMMRDLLSFHKKRGGFPKDLRELEGMVWEKKQGRIYSNKDRALTHRNYHYLYTRIGHHRFTLWAIPTGRQRDEAATLFLIVSPSSHRRWKGPALDPENVRSLSIQPSANQLTLLGLIEQPEHSRQRD